MFKYMYVRFAHLSLLTDEFLLSGFILKSNERIPTFCGI